MEVDGKRRNTVVLVQALGVSPLASSPSQQSRSLGEQSEPSFLSGMLEEDTARACGQCRCHFHTIPPPYLSGKAESNLPPSSRLCCFILPMCSSRTTGLHESQTPSSCQAFLFPAKQHLTLSGGMSSASLHICIWWLSLRISDTLPWVVTMAVKFFS